MVPEPGPWPIPTPNVDGVKQSGSSLWNTFAPGIFWMDGNSIGYVAAALTTSSFFPQAIKTLRTDDTRSISLSMYSLFTSGIAIWGVFGLVTGNGPLILANGITLIPASFVLQKKIRHRLLGCRQLPFLLLYGT